MVPKQELLHSSPICIQEAKVGDENKLLDLYSEDTFFCEADRDALVEFSKKDFDEIGWDKRKIWLAYSLGKVVGVIHLLFNPQQKIYVGAKGIPTGELHHLKVKPSFQGQGISSQLNNALEKEARSRGLRRLVLNVSDTNEHAKTIYSKWGYVVDHYESESIPGREEVKSCIMVKRLT